MADILRMRFQSAKRPDEQGTLVLDTDGTVRVEPSEQMLEEIARLEQKAVESSARNSAVASCVLIGLGLIAAALGWYAGRVGGRMRDQFMERRDVRQVDAEYVPDRSFHLRFHEDGLQSLSLGWVAGEYNSEEAERFMQVYYTLREASGT